MNTAYPGGVLFCRRRFAIPSAYLLFLEDAFGAVAFFSLFCDVKNLRIGLGVVSQGSHLVRYDI